MELDASELADTIFRHVDPALEPFFLDQLLSEDIFHGGGHPGSGLSRPHHDDTPDSIQRKRFMADNKRATFEPQRIAQKPLGPNSIHTGLPNSQSIAA
jgi:hypothetical protein